MAGAMSQVLGEGQASCLTGLSPWTLTAAPVKGAQTAPFYREIRIRTSSESKGLSCLRLSLNLGAWACPERSQEASKGDREAGASQNSTPCPSASVYPTSPRSITPETSWTNKSSLPSCRAQPLSRRMINAHFSGHSLAAWHPGAGCMVLGGASLKLYCSVKFP